MQVLVCVCQVKKVANSSEDGKGCEVGESMDLGEIEIGLIYVGDSGEQEKGKSMSEAPVGREGVDIMEGRG